MYKRQLLGLVLPLAACCGERAEPAAGALRDVTRAQGIAVALDREQRAGERLLNPSTQSVNRRHSVLRELDRVDVELDLEALELSLRMREAGGAEGREVIADGIDARFLVPLLPYPRAGRLDAFDRFNLMLAEYARNGVSLGPSREPRELGHFRSSEGLLTRGPEYTFEAGAIAPNPRLRPKRLHVVNNCLEPGLWELSASDSAGEMFHGWLELPRGLYTTLVRRANGLDEDAAGIAEALAYRGDADAVRPRLERLRRPLGERWELPARPVATKVLGGYSTQDSRRKVQQGYFWVERGGARVEARTHADLRAGDVFRLRSFVPPGIYTEESLEAIPFDPDWDRAELALVEPRTAYPGGAPALADRGHLEVTLYSGDGRRAVVVGNVPLALLVLQEDYAVPAFGVGVLPPSELVERRALRLREGPRPHYAYLLGLGGGGRRLLNNHEHGLEQVFLRPFQKGGELHLRLTLVSYERIVDLIEVEIALPAELAGRVLEASAAYEPPLFRVYTDSNIL